MTWTPPEPAYSNAILIPNWKLPPVYTLDQLIAVRRETIEQCAKLCDDETEDVPLTLMADAIRALGEQT